MKATNVKATCTAAHGLRLSESDSESESESESEINKTFDSKQFALFAFVRTTSITIYLLTIPLLEFYTMPAE